RRRGGRGNGNVFRICRPSHLHDYGLRETPSCPPLLLSMFPLLLSFLPSVSTLICYHCISPLSSDIPLEAQHTLKSLLYSAYNVPPVHQLCGVEDDPEFRSLDSIPCSDSCMKILISHGDTTLLLRGCNSSLFLRGYHLASDASCSPSSTPSICDCSQDLCNSFSISSFILPIIISLFLSGYSL
ncbi:hypothetical protein PMAYCL1PPCAC_07084, partial [Pristionchus mayeri]